MLEPVIESSLNAQLEKEASASYSYLAMATWCDQQSLEGCAQYFYRQSSEEYAHMMKILHYLIERNAKVLCKVTFPQPNVVLQAFAKEHPASLRGVVVPFTKEPLGSATAPQPAVLRAGRGMLIVAKQVPGFNPTTRAGTIVSLVAVVPTNLQVGDFPGHCA